MLPHIDGKKGLVTMNNRRVGIVVGLDSKLARLVNDEPSPAGSEVGLGLLLERLESLVNSAKILFEFDIAL